MMEKSRRDRVICLVISDGAENGSQEADERQVASMVRSRLEWGNWTFLWLNLEGKPSKNARALGIDCTECRREEIAKALPKVAHQIAQVAARLTPGQRGLLIEGGER